MATERIIARGEGLPNYVSLGLSILLNFGYGVPDLGTERPLHGLRSDLVLTWLVRRLRWLLAGDAGVVRPAAEVIAPLGPEGRQGARGGSCRQPSPAPSKQPQGREVVSSKPVSACCATRI